MSKNKTRGRPQKKSNRVRDADIKGKAGKKSIELISKAKKYLLKNKKKILPYIAFAFIGNKLSFLYRNSCAKDFLGRLWETIDSIKKIFSWPVVSLKVKDLLAGVVIAVSFRLLVYVKMSNAKHYRTGEEYGSASFGNERDIISSV